MQAQTVTRNTNAPYRATLTAELMTIFGTEIPGATAVAAEACQCVIDICKAFGRSDPYRESRDNVSKALFDAIEHVVDPHGQTNPDGPGLPIA